MKVTTRSVGPTPPNNESGSVAVIIEQSPKNTRFVARNTLHWQVQTSSRTVLLFAITNEEPLTHQVHLNFFFFLRIVQYILSLLCTSK